ncbi:MAG TPA: DUF2332 domain-containing protein [Myxococcota bacterium]|nr:DUF2332 domain-containing protein [Myxococcota bacterium]
MPSPSVDPAVLDAFRRQVPACREDGSEFTARILERCLADLETGGPLARLVDGYEGNPFLDALCQRVLGAVQGLVLAGRAPELARLHPFAGGTPEWPAVGDAFVAAVGAHLDEIKPRMKRQVQTNEVRRCCGLLGGFLEIARATGLPLRLLEMGSSAGLVMFWDRYRYELGPHRWGEPDAPLTLATEWIGPPPALDAPARVASRRGCDLDPIDATDPDELRFIQSFYWADQKDRMDLLVAAARALPGPAPIERMRGGDFVAREVAELPEGVATVLYHSTMWWYVPRDEQQRITAAMEAAGARATAERPLAWLRSEPPSLDCVEIRLRLWPGGEDRLLGRAQHHGRWVEWLA